MNRVSDEAMEYFIDDTRPIFVQIAERIENDIIAGELPAYENGRVLSQLCAVSDSQKYPNGYRVLDVLEQAAFFFPQWEREYAFALVEAFRLPLSRGMLSAAGIIVGLASRAADHL